MRKGERVASWEQNIYVKQQQKSSFRCWCALPACLLVALTLYQPICHKHSLFLSISFVACANVCDERHAMVVVCALVQNVMYKINRRRLRIYENIADEQEKKKSFRTKEETTTRVYLLLCYSSEISMRKGHEKKPEILECVSMRARQTLDKHESSSKTERKTKKKTQVVSCSSGTGLISSLFVWDDGDGGVRCVRVSKNGQTYNEFQFIYHHIYLPCVMAQSIWFVYRISALRGTLFSSAYPCIHYWLLLSGPIIEKKFLSHFWWRRWFRLHGGFVSGVGMYLFLYGRRTCTQTHGMAWGSLNLRRQKFVRLRGYFEIQWYFSARCNLCMYIVGCIEWERCTRFLWSIGCSLCTRAHMMYEPRHQHTHTHTLALARLVIIKTGTTADVRWSFMGTQPHADTHTRAWLVENNLPKKKKKSLCTSLAYI